MQHSLETITFEQSVEMKCTNKANKENSNLHMWFENIFLTVNRKRRDEFSEPKKRNHFTTPDLFGRTFYLYANRSAFNQSGSLRRSLTRIYLTFPHYKKHISENCDAS